jgi:hypothetical protein
VDFEICASIVLEGSSGAVATPGLYRLFAHIFRDATSQSCLYPTGHGRVSQPVVTSLPAGKGAFVICILFLVLVLLFTLGILEFWND